MHGDGEGSPLLRDDKSLMSSPQGLVCLPAVMVGSSDSSLLGGAGAHGGWSGDMKRH